MLIAIDIAEEIQELQRIALQWCQNPAEDLLGLSAPHEPIFFEDLLRLPPGLLVSWLRLRSCYFRHLEDLQRIWVYLGH